MQRFPDHTHLKCLCMYNMHPKRPSNISIHQPQQSTHKTCSQCYDYTRLSWVSPTPRPRGHQPTQEHVCLPAYCSPFRKLDLKPAMASGSVGTQCISRIIHPIKAGPAAPAARDASLRFVAGAGSPLGGIKNLFEGQTARGCGRTSGATSTGQQFAQGLGRAAICSDFE